MTPSIRGTGKRRTGHFTLCVACVLATLGMMIAVSLLLTFPSSAFAADELITIKKSGTAKADSANEAAKEIQSALTAETARELVLDMLGEKRFSKNKTAAESKIVRQSSKFIPFVNSTPPVQGADGLWKMDVELRVSMASMRKMVLDAGLLNDAEGPASILPLVAFTDRSKGISVRWWQGEVKDESHKFLSSLSQIFYDKAQASFAKEGFHLIKPQGSQISPLPEPYRTEQPSAADLVFISDYFRTPMILKGEIRVKESVNVPGAFFCALKLQVLQPVNNRSIAEVSRQFVSDVGPFEAVVRNKMTTEFPDIAKDLAAQVLEVWQRGTLNTNLVRLVVRARLTPKQLNDFKAGVLQNVREFKSLKERMFEPGLVVFEADYSGATSQVGERLRNLNLPAFDTKVAEVAPTGVTVDVRTR